MLQRCPPLFGVWHIYKYAVTLAYRHYLPVLALVLHPQIRVQPDHEKVRCAAKLRYMENIFAALLVVAPDVQDPMCNQYAAAPHPVRLAAAVN